MIGYCSDCMKNVKMTGIYTDRLANGRLLNKGRCPKCKGPVWKTLKDNEILITDAGHHIPKKIYAKKQTPKFLKKIEENNIYQQSRTLKQIKQEVGSYEKENFISR